MTSAALKGTTTNMSTTTRNVKLRGGRSRAGGGRGRGGSRQAQNEGEPHRGGRNGRGGGRGRGDRTEGMQHTHAMDASDLTTRLSKVAASEAPVALTPKTAGENEEDEEEVCFLCASDISFLAVPPCNHWTCHVCALRMRALMGNKACSYCKVSDFLLRTTKNMFRRLKNNTNSRELQLIANSRQR